VLSIIKGFRNGAVYGAKIRFPHALVMTFLFRNDSFAEKLKFILRATFNHSKNLAFFVFIYKSIMLLLKLARGKQETLHPAISGLIGGYIVFGEDNPINNQIVLYLFSRIMVGWAKVAVKQTEMSPPGRSFSIFAAAVWACVMWLFTYERDTLQSSLQASMQYLYIDSNNWKSLKTFIWHNK